MPLYSYTGKNSKSERVHGSIDADDIPSAKEELTSKGITIEEVFQISYDAAIGPDSVPSQQPKSSLEEKEILPVKQQTPPLSPKKETHHTPNQLKTPNQPKTVIEKVYYPVTDTLRLYAGWLLAWYGLVYALGSYQSTRDLSFEIPYLMGIYYSPLVLSFTLGSFLFLLCSGLHRISGKGIFPGLFFSALGIALFGLYRMNV